MSFRLRVLIILLCVLILYAGLDYGIQRLVVYPSFISLERREAEKEIERCVAALRRELHHLDGLCHDWAAWNDTYEFVEDRNPDYISDNLLDESYQNNQINLLAICKPDGEVVWSFRAAPYAKRIVSYGRVESAWPVHGSVLVARNTVYFAAGRSSYLDGGIYMYGLDVATGAIRCQARLDGPHPDLAKPSNRAHEMDGSRNDILVSDRGKLFLTQNAFDLTLKPLEAPTIAKYGARKMDRHLVATGGFLDDSGFDRIYWMYAERWPGLYVAVDASKAGQILVFDDDTVYGLHLFTRKFSRSPYFQPGSGCELFADAVGNEPVLNKAQASRERGTMSRAAPPKWSVQIPVRARAMALAGNHLFLAGPPDVIDAKDPLGSFEGRKGAQLWAVSTADGKKLAAYDLTAPPVFDGLIAADGSLFMTMRDGTVRCWDAKGNE